MSNQTNSLSNNRNRAWTLCILFFMLGAIVLRAQNQNISLKVENVTLRTLFNQIEKTSPFRFSYLENSLPVAADVTVNVENKSIESVLNTILPPRNLSFSRKGNIFAIQTQRQQQQGVSKTISGVILDEKGETVIGANVVVKGTTTGTVTDIDGKFELQSPSNSTLVISYIGYQPMEVSANKSHLNITLKENNQQLDEVVVVGYGTARKLNLTGAVATASVKEIQARPITSVSNGLQGLMPGVTVVNATGLPGQSTGTIRIRGVGTIGNANPLVLIDGVEGNINILNPEDIESVSVLKDAASASIYGSRGANGVILVTTKNVGKKDVVPQISVSGYYGLQTPTRLPEMVSSVDYIKLDMEATRNVGKTANYHQSHIDKILDGSDPDYFNNTNWIDAINRSSAPQQNYSVSVNGNNSGIGYLLSYNYLNQEGLTKGNTTYSNRHNIRLKLNTKVASIFDITANVSYINREYATPSGGFSSDGGAIYTAMRISPVVPMKFQDGGWGYGGGSANPVALLYDSGKNNFNSDEISGNFIGKVDFMKGWNATVTYSFISTNSLRDILSKTINYYRPGTQDIWYSTNPINKYENRDYRSVKNSLIAQTNYEKQFGKHNLSAVAGFSQESYTELNFTAARTNLVTEMDPSLNFGSSDTQTNSASAATWALRSGFGRINYNFSDRYLFEANMRYDLTSRFAKSNRAGVFPSFSAGWRLSEEAFMEKTRQYVDNIKVRGSWGILGNQYVGSNEYPYMAIVGIVTVPRIGTIANDGYTQTSLPNPYLHWETINMTNIGLDFDLFKSRLSVSADYFIKDTKDILLKLTYPGILGMSPTEQNAGKVRNKGWEITTRWNDKVGKDFTYGATFNIADVTNEIKDFGGLAPSIGSYSIRRVGDPIDAFYGYVAQRLAMPDDFERYNQSTGRYENPKFPVLSDDMGKIQPGDIILQDISGPEGKPDGVVDATYDRKVIGSSIPRFTFSLMGNMGYKGFDMSFLIQGVGQCDGYLEGAGRHAFIDQSAYPQKVHMDRWTFDNPNPHASYPRLTFTESYNQRFSSFWLENAAYIRLKNIQIGYSLPKNLIKRFRAERLRFYVSADNLFTLTDYFYAYDPETPISKGGYYPQVKTFVFGFNLTLK